MARNESLNGLRSLGRSIAVAVAFGLVGSTPARITFPSGPAHPGRTADARFEKTVTLDAPGWSLKKICAAISAQLGEEVEPHGDCVNDYLIVHVHNVPWSDLRKKLAWAEYGSWYLDGKVLTLAQDKSQIQARLQKNVVALANSYEAIFQKDQAKENELPFDADKLARSIKLKAEDIARHNKSNYPADFVQANSLATAFNDFQSQMPSSLALQDIVEAIPARALAAIPVSDRVVFSNHPTSLQAPLSDSALDKINTLINRQAHLSKALIATGIDPTQIPDGFNPNELTTADTFNISIRPLNGFGMRATLRIFDAKGSVTYTKTRVFNRFSMPNNQVPAPTGFVQLAPGVVQDLKSLMFAGANGPTEAFLSKLRNPEKYDPLSITLDPIAAAVAQGKSIIIRDDSQMLAATGVWTFKNGTEVPLNFFANEGEITDLNPDPNWLGMRVNYLYLTTNTTIPRAAYADLVHAISPDGVMAFLPAMNFAAACGTDGEGSVEVASAFLMPLTYRTFSLGDDQRSWDMYCLVGSLDPDQLNSAESAHGLDLATLGSEPSRIFKAILLTKFDDQMFSASGSHESYLPPTLDNEPTYAFAHSLPLAVLTIRQTQGSVIRYKVSYKGFKTPFNMESNPNDLADIIENENSNPGTVYDFSSMKVSPQITTTIMISYPGTNRLPLVANFSTEAHTIATYNGWENLPAPIRQAVEDAMKRKGFKIPEGSQ